MMKNPKTKYVVEDAPIGFPTIEEFRQAGGAAGAEDRTNGTLPAADADGPVGAADAGLVASDGAVSVKASLIRRNSSVLRAGLVVVSSLVERPFHGPLAAAQADLESASEELALANERVDTAGQALLAADRTATARRTNTVGLADPDLLGPELHDGSGAAASHGGGGAGEPGAGEPAGVGGERPRAFRFFGERKLPKPAAYGCLAALAIAEGFLNDQSFAATGENANDALLLAVLVGVGVIGLSHRLGDSLADLLENRTGARGRSPARLAEAVLGFPALVVGILATAAIRSSYYKTNARLHPSQHITVPTTALIGLAFMLAVAAIAVSLASRNPFADQMKADSFKLEDVTHEHGHAQEGQVRAQKKVSGAAAVLRQLFGELDREFRTQSGWYVYCREAFLDAYAAAAGVRIVDDFPEIELPQLVQDARTWLAAHPHGTLATHDLPYAHVPAETTVGEAQDEEIPAPTPLVTPVDPAAASDGDGDRPAEPEDEDGTGGQQAA